MVLIQIRDVDARVRDELKARAAQEGLSLNAYLTGLLTEAVERPTRASVLARIRSRAETASTSSVDLIRAARDEQSGVAGDPSRRRA